ncbi:MAG: nucleotidyltransferase domain-containing protein [Thermoproteales archaeon]|nr:nucleotidyltransferase domain-containing protein [Thermoproteales archaeon]
MVNKVTPLRALMEWREYARILYRAVKNVMLEAEIYITGGVAENRITARSDIDVLIVLPYTPTFNEAVELRTKILEKAEDLELPLYAPIELHIIGKEELKKYMKKGKVIPVKDVTYLDPSST